MPVRSLTPWQRSLAGAAVVFLAYLVLARHHHPLANESFDTPVQASAVDHKAGGPTLDGCPVLPADNVWNTRIDKLPKDPHSDTWIASMGPARGIHPDFGADPANGIPFALIPDSTQRVKVDFQYRDDSDLGNYPLPANAPIEGGKDATGDRHVLLLDPVRCMLFEIFDAHPLPDGTWKAGSGVKLDLTSNQLRQDGKTSADAAGLPILPGLVRYDEAETGDIRHALRFTVPHTQSAHVWPATHDASRSKDPNLPPLGIRLRLRADFDTSHYSPTNRAILNALKHYGMFLADNGSAFFLSGVPDRRWDDDDLHHLTGVRGSDFEVVDESGLQMMADSGRVDPKAVQ